MDEIDRQSVTFSEVVDETNDNESSDDDYYTDDDYVLIQKLKCCLTMNAVMMNIKTYVPFLAQCTLSLSPKNFRKLYSSFKFQKLKKGCIGLKR